jgi:hypothetical protein
MPSGRAISAAFGADAEAVATADAVDGAGVVSPDLQATAERAMSESPSARVRTPKTYRVERAA